VDLTGAPLITGDNNVVATFTPTDSTDYTTANNNFDQVVGPATTSVDLVSSVNPSTYGQSVTATATVTPSDLAGSVQFTVNGTDLGSPVAVSSGSAQSPDLTGAPLATGDNTVVATFTPTDSTDYSTANDSFDQVVGQATPTVNVGSSVNPSTFGQSVTATATITPSDLAGTVQFRVDGVDLGSPVVVSSGSAQSPDLSGAPLATGDNNVVAIFTPTDSTDYTQASKTLDQVVDQATPALNLGSSVNPSTYGQSVTATATIAPSGLAGTVQFTVNGVDLGSPVTVSSGSAQSTDLTGAPLTTGDNPVVATFTPTDTTDYTTASNSIDQVVDKATSAVALASSTNPSVFGQPVTATATVTPSDLAGSVQFTVNGTDLGSPVVVSSGSAQSPDLSGALAINDNSVGVRFTPTDTTDYTTADATTLDQVVDQAATTTTVSVGASTLSAVVAAVAPGAGTPTGSVTFSVDGTSVGNASVVDGVATLTDTVPTDSAHDVSAVYSGDTDFTGSSDSTSRTDPTITAALTSAAPKTSFGWYRTPVMVTFTCTATSAPLSSGCPSPVMLSKNQGGQSVTRTITANDGGTATVVANSINVDRVKPHVVLRGVRDHGVYDGVASAGRCAGTDALSGISTCVITTVTSAPSTKDTRTVHYTAVATDKAGNTATVHSWVRVLGIYVKSVPTTRGAFDVKIGHDYTMGFVSKARPSYFDATPAFGPKPTPFKKGPRMIYAGHGVWTIRIGITKSMRHHAVWNIGVRSHGTLHVIRIRLSS
jgi:hypothetical protein